MGTATVAKSTSVLFDEDIYGAKIVKVDEVTGGAAYESKPQYRITFEVTDPDSDFKGNQIARWCNRTFIRDEDGDEAEVIPLKSALFGLMVAVNGGEEPEIGESFDIAEFFVGKKCRISIVNKKDAQGTAKSKVSAVLPLKKGSKAGAAA